FVFFLFFFFSSRRRHTRSDRDWSSDVCSSDLTDCLGDLHGQIPTSQNLDFSVDDSIGVVARRGRGFFCLDRVYCASFQNIAHQRSEERRVGKECRSRWWTNRYKKKTLTSSREL